jgi:hypothetical protein
MKWVLVVGLVAAVAQSSSDPVVVSSWSDLRTKIGDLAAGGTQTYKLQTPFGNYDGPIHVDAQKHVVIVSDAELEIDANLQAKFFYVEDGAHLALTNLHMMNGHATGGYTGGGIELLRSSSAVLTNCTFSGCITGADDACGGAIAATQSSTIQLLDCKFKVGPDATHTCDVCGTKAVDSIYVEPDTTTTISKTCPDGTIQSILFKGGSIPPGACNYPPNKELVTCNPTKTLYECTKGKCTLAWTGLNAFQCETFCH